MALGDEQWEKRPSRGIVQELAWDRDAAFTTNKWADSAGNWPSGLDKHVGKTFFHPGRGHLYEIVGIVHQAEDDRWELAYRRKTQGGLLVGPLHTHRPEDFFREGRFMEVKK